MSDVAGESESDSCSPGNMKGVDAESPLIQNVANVSTSFDKVMTKIGPCPLFVIIVITSGIGLLSDTLEVMSISFVMSHIQEDSQLTRLEESALSGCLFAGMCIGGLVWGSCADLNGRRYTLLISLTMNGVAAFTSALMPSFYPFLFCRFLSGVGVGGSIPVIFSYASEFSWSKVRDTVTSIISTCWMIGTILAAGGAWVTLSEAKPINTYKGGFASWRLYMMLCSLPSLLAAFTYMFLPPSPKFLLQTGRTKQGLSELRKYAARSRHVDVTDELNELRRLTEDDICIDHSTTTVYSMVWSMIRNMVNLFRGGILKISLLLLMTMVPVYFGYYGFMMWFPEYIKHQIPESLQREPGYVYKESLYVAISSLPGNIFTIFCTDIIGPKPILVSSLLLSAGSIFLLWEFTAPSAIVALTCLFNGVSVPTFNMCNVCFTQLYPTELRTTAFGFHTALLRIVIISATTFFSLFIDTAPTFPILVTAILLLFAAGVSFFMPLQRRAITA